jgi:hypothetical protein
MNSEIAWGAERWVTLIGCPTIISKKEQQFQPYACSTDEIDEHSLLSGPRSLPLLAGFLAW